VQEQSGVPAQPHQLHLAEGILLQFVLRHHVEELFPGQTGPVAEDGDELRGAQPLKGLHVLLLQRLQGLLLQGQERLLKVLARPGGSGGARGGAASFLACGAGARVAGPTTAAPPRRRAPATATAATILTLASVMAFSTPSARATTSAGATPAAAWPAAISVTV